MSLHCILIGKFVTNQLNTFTLWVRHIHHIKSSAKSKLSASHTSISNYSYIFFKVWLLWINWPSAWCRLSMYWTSPCTHLEPPHSLNTVALAGLPLSSTDRQFITRVANCSSSVLIMYSATSHYCVWKLNWFSELVKHSPQCVAGTGRDQTLAGLKKRLEIQRGSEEIYVTVLWIPIS